MEPLQLADDLDAVLVGADRAVGAEAEEQRPHPAGRLQIAYGVPGQTEARHVIHYPHGKAGRGASDASSSNTAAHMAG